MSNEKRFTVAGTSTHNGTSKARFANDLTTRVKTLTKGGHTNIQLIELPNPMTKAEAVAFLQTQGASINAEIDLVAVGNKQAAVAVKAKAVANKATLKTGTAKSKKTSPKASKSPKAIKTVSAKAPKAAPAVASATV